MLPRVTKYKRIYKDTLKIGTFIRVITDNLAVGFFLGRKVGLHWPVGPFRP